MDCFRMSILIVNNVLLMLTCFVVLLSETAAQTSDHCATIDFPTLSVNGIFTMCEHYTVNVPFRLETICKTCSENAPENIFIYVYKPSKGEVFCGVRFTCEGICKGEHLSSGHCGCDPSESNVAILRKQATREDSGIWSWKSGERSTKEYKVSFKVHSGATYGLAGRGDNCTTTTTAGSVMIGNSNDNKTHYQDDEEDGGSLVTSVIVGVLCVNVVTIIVVVVVVNAYRGKFSRKQGRHPRNPSPRDHEEEVYNVLQLHRFPEPRVPIQATKDEEDYGYATVV